MKGFAKLSYGAYLALVIFAFILGTLFGSQTRGIQNVKLPSKSSSLPEAVNVGLVDEVWGIIHKKFVGEVKDTELATGMLRGMVSGLNDPYSAYADKKETEQFAEDISGKFSGIGVEIGRKNGLITVVSPLKNSPAEKAGVKAQDVIYSIDGKTVPQDESLTEVASKIRGPEGTSVKLGVLRDKREGALDITVRREKITLESVTLSMKDDVAVINITEFHDDTARKFKTIARQILNAKVKGIVLDMRNNPGGVLTGAVDIAGHFVKDGEVVVKEVPSDPTNAILHHSEGPADLLKIPVVVLVNGGSASASEILAGALRDIRGAKIIGEKTFGKGCVQELVGLSDGSSLRITIAKWYTPKGAEISEKGITPDIESKQSDNDKIDVQMDKAIAIVKAETGQ